MLLPVGLNMMRKNKQYKESKVVDVEDYFKQEFVDGELTFVCNICDKGLDSEVEITNHINGKHESLVSDGLKDSELYEGFDKDGNQI